MTRSYSGNGRTSSFNEEEGSSSSNGRNTYLSNVRPENRSTLCSVMAQLTEDVQPSFETTLKSKAVSEKCNVKFTCVVSGYPAPELKWYKDDKEMDRYCGLPKYEIHRNGKTHTLHIYDCTLDDAAIYQVSAVNSKGIVSCSGVLEVGTMSEYQIHQRFFAKLKAKAEKKRLDLEGTNKKDTADKVEKEQPQKSPERTPRKRPIPQRQRNVEEPPESAGDKNMQNTVQEPVPPAFPVAPEVKKDGEPSSVNKKIKISNGTDAQTEPPSSPKSSVSSRSGAQGSAAENHYDGGMGLAQFLAETLQSQAAEEKQANKEETVQGVTDSEAKAQEEDGQQKAGEEAMEQDTLQVRERADQEVKDESKEISGSSTPTPTPTRHEARLHHKGPKELKEHKDHHKPASLTSMLHSVKDFFFGKNKKDTHEHRYHSDSPNTPEQTPPSFYLQSEERSNDDNGMSTEVAQLQDPTPERPHVAEKQEDPCRAEMASESPGRVTVGGSADQAMEVTAEGGPLSRPQLRSEAVGKDDRLLNVKSEDSLDASRPPPDPSHAAVEEATVETRPGLEVVGPVLSQRPHTQNRDFCVPKDMEKADGKVEAEEVIQVPYPIPIINVSCTEEGIEQAASDAVALSVLVTPPIPETAEIRDKTEQTRMAEPTESTEHTSAPREIPEPTDNIERREETEHGDAPGHKERTEKDELPAADNASEVAEFRETSKHRGTCENGERPELKDTTEQHVAAVIEDKKTPEHTEPEPTSKDDTKQNSQMPQGELTEQTVGENRLIVANEPAKSDMNVLSKTVEASIENEITQSLKEARIESFMSVERLSFKPPLYPSLSPASLRKFMSKASGEGEGSADRQSDKAEDSLSGGSTPTSSLSCESSPRLKRRDSLSLIRSATPEELASGARRKIFIPKTKEETEDCSNKKDSPYMSPGQARRASFLQPPTGPNTPPVERRSPLLNRRKATLEVPKVVEEIPVPEEVSIKLEDKSGDKKPDPLKAPQVIRKIRGEPFPDASGHLKLWCQFFNVLSDSTIKWYKEEQEILEVQRSGSDESQVALAIVLASSLDCGVYGCTINNEYGTDTTDFLLSEDVMGEILLKDDLEVGEEIEMTPLMFNRGLGDSGTWGGKFFGRIMTETVHLGAGWTHKTSRVKVIYGLEPVFESGASCIMKIQNPIPYGTKLESNLAERNQEITKQECKVQNMIREYCKIFSAEARVNENFGSALEVVSQYLMYRPANSVPYATVEAELPGLFETYCWVDAGGKLNSKGVSEAEQKCSTFQHWLYEWTHSNLLTTRLEGVDFKLTNVRVVTKSKGYQGLSERGSPDVFDQFVTHHQCNYYCGLLGLRPLKTMDSLQPPIKMKGSRSPLLNRKSGGPGSPHVQKKSSLSPHSQRRAGTSPKVPRKNLEAEDSTGKSRAVDTRCTNGV
uniref:non-specific serine/threonine protein kinase n=1 Tax=Knipowitschia caucasica TaxID=637954 RepID=A0AAV2L4D1_KNICA